MIVRKTGRCSGRVTQISPENSDLRLLSYRRTVLDDVQRSVKGESGDEEIALFLLKGGARVRVGADSFDLAERDSVFIPPNRDFSIERLNGFADLAEAAAPSDAQGAPVFIPYTDAREDPRLSLSPGSDTYSRDVVKVIDGNVRASRLLCGYTIGKPGNWTSWAPHEHADAREEVYLYIDMPRPAFGLQMIYEDLENPQTVAAVFEDDAAVITRGYHPNTGIPGHGIKFLWMMAGFRAYEDREWSDMNDQPDFAGQYD